MVPTEFLNELEKLGFVRGVSQYQWNKLIMPVLRRYYEVNDHLDVPQRFVVPRGDETWPKATWGWSLGSILHNLRSHGRYAEQLAADREELERMKFCFTTIYERDWNERVLPALATHHREFGDCLVHTSFVVPSEVPWTEKSWGMNLGTTVNNVRKGISYVKQFTRDRDFLDSLGFVWDVRAFLWKEQIVPALEVYSEKHGHCRLTGRFVVPSHLPWPKKTWGLKLGEKVRNMRQYGTFFEYCGRNAEWLDALGFNIKLWASPLEKRVAPVDRSVRKCDRRPRNSRRLRHTSSTPWPKEMWGVHLGLIVARNAQHLR